MAGIIKRKSGIYSVRVMIGDERKTVSLGTRSESRAERAKEFIQDLATSRATGELPEKETKRWLSNQSPKLRRRLAAAGLTDDSSSEKTQPMTLGPFLQSYIDRYGPAKKTATVTTWNQCKRLLLEFFPETRPLEAITTGDAEDFRNYLLTRTGAKGGNRKAKPLSEATTRRRCGCAKGFFAYGVAKGIIKQNPFDTKKVPTTSPRGKQKEFVSSEVAEKIMGNLPHAEWRLLFALARWGGMRVPSEPEQLLWTDVDFEQKRINFRSPKTEHHDGRDRREIPIFPELEVPLREVFEQANPGEVYVLPFLRRVTGTALRKPLLAALKAAQVKPWPKLWTALRASRVTDLRESFPAHVVDAWIGHDDKIARKHYAQTLDQHFDRALQKCSHFESSTNTQPAAPVPENAEIPALICTDAHSEAQEWAILDLNQ